MLTREAGFIESLLREAGQELRTAAKRRDTLQQASKAAPLDVVTEADIAVEELIRSALQRQFPEDGFWGEESGMPAAPSRGAIWICDPIDGTRSFLRFGVNYCVSLGRMVNGQMQQGYIYDPTVDDFYAAAVGSGATINGRRMALKPLGGLGRALVGTGYSERVAAHRQVRLLSQILASGAMMHQHGSGALAIAQVAAGRLDAYVEFHLNAWDALPALLIAQEAGATCKSWSAADLATGTAVLCANPEIYQQIDDFMRSSAM